MTTRFAVLAFTIALLIGFLSVLPYFGLNFEYSPGDVGDNRLCNYLLEHGYKWITGQTSESFFDAPFYYPARASIRYSENFLGSAPFYVPWRLVGFDRETSFQIWILLGYMLNFTAAAWVLNKLGFHWFGVLSGAYVFAFSQAALTHSWHIQLHYRFAIPLAWYFLHLFLSQFSSKHLLLSLTFAAWQFYCSIYEGYFLALFMVAYLLVKVCTKPVVREYMRNAPVRSVAAHGLILFIFLISVAALGRGYVRSASDPHLMEARRPELISMLPRPISYFVGYTGSSEVGWLYERIDLPMKHEHVMFVGLIPWIGVFFLLITTKKTDRHPEVISALLAMGVIIVATLYLNGYSFYFVLMKFPGVNGVRGVTRVILILLLPFAIATAQLLHLFRVRLLGVRAAYTTAILSVVAMWLFIENRTTPFRYLKVEGQERVRQLAAQLPAQLPQDAVLAYLYPLNGRWEPYEIDAMLTAQQKNIPTMNGYSGDAPDGFRYLHSCGDIKLALDDIGRRNESFTVHNPAAQVITVGNAIDAPCAPFLSSKASETAEPLPEEAFRANIEVVAPDTIVANSQFQALVRVTNGSDVFWPVKGLPSGKFAMRTSCQWLSSGSQEPLMAYPNRFDLPYDLQPHEAASMAVLLTAPGGPGAYTIECDAIQELVHWFNVMGSKTGKTLVQVQRDPAFPAIQGFLDAVNVDEIAGWAWNQDRPDLALQVEINDGENRLATVMANRFRKDLHDAGIGNGTYSFTIPNPLHQRDNKTHIVHAIISGTNIELTGSPKTFKLGP